MRELNLGIEFTPSREKVGKDLFIVGGIISVQEDKGDYMAPSGLLRGQM
jgi:hypothetical protein